MKKPSIFSILIVIIFTIPLLGQQQVLSGVSISKETTWSGTIIIEGDVTVSKNARLTIAPGTQVLFRPNVDMTNSGKDKTRCELIIKGILISNGRVDSKVTFSSAAKEPRMGDWYGILLENPNQRSIIDYSIIQFAHDGISVKKNSSIIRNSQLLLNYNSAISCGVKAQPAISRNIISDNGYAGIIARLGAKPVLSQNLISRNEIGIIVFGTSVPNLGNLKRGNDYNEGQNNIFENTDYDLYNHSDILLIAENNSWGSSSDTEGRIFGNVDVQPLYIQQNIDDLFDIAQETSTDPIANNTVIEEKAPVAPAKEPAKQSAPKTIAANTLSPVVATGIPEAKDVKQEEPKKEAEAAPVKTQVAERAIASTENTPIEQQINYSQVFLENFLDTRKGQILKKVAPKVGMSGASGRVIVRAIVGLNGKVESASVVRGLDIRSDEAALDAAKLFEFKPGSVKGVPVRFYYNILFAF